MTHHDEPAARGEWVTLVSAISALIEAGRLPPFDIDPTDGGQYMAPGADEQLSNLLCPLAFAGKVKIMAYPTGHGEEMPNGPLQLIPGTYFHRQRLFYAPKGISRMPCDPTIIDWRRDEALTTSQHPEPDWTDVLINGQDLDRLLGTPVETAQLRKAIKPAAKSPGPTLDHVETTLRVARVWKVQREAKGTLPKTPHGRAVACLEDCRADLKHGYESLRKIFEGKYTAALRAVEEGRARPIWEP